MSLPPGFEQIDLFASMAAEPKTQTKPKRRPRQKRKGIVYSCPKCGKALEIDIPAVVIVCGCGRRMEREGR
jgi:hypothetical protein